MNAWQWLVILVTAAIVLPVLWREIAARAHEREEHREQVDAMIAVEPWRAPEVGAHWLWCALDRDHEGRCHIRSCKADPVHEGACSEGPP